MRDGKREGFCETKTKSGYVRQIRLQEEAVDDRRVREGRKETTFFLRIQARAVKRRRSLRWVNRGGTASGRSDLKKCYQVV